MPWLRRVGLGRRALRRPIDRFENLVLLVVVLVGLAAIPLGMAVGTADQRNGLAAAAAENVGRTQVTAVLLEDVPVVMVAEESPTDVLAAARWRPPGGAARTGQVPVAPGSLAGEHIPIWIDSSGEQVVTPLTADRARWDGVLVGTGTTAAVIAALALIMCLVRWRLDKARFSAWEAEWHRVEPRWTQRAG